MGMHMLVFRVAREEDAHSVFDFFRKFKGKLVRIEDISATGLSRSIKTISLWIEEVEKKEA